MKGWKIITFNGPNMDDQEPMIIQIIKEVEPTWTNGCSGNNKPIKSHTYLQLGKYSYSNYNQR